MAIKIVMLKTGQQVITDLKEIRQPTDDGSTGDLLGLVMVTPLVLGVGEYIEDTKQYAITFERIMPFSKDWQFKVSLNDVTLIGDPLDSVKEKYVEQIYPDGIPEETQE